MARSRLLSVKEKREFRQAIALIAITLTLLIGFVFWGLPGIARLVGNNLIRENTGSNKSVELKPTTPILTDIPEATNSAKLDVNGFAQPGVEVSLFINATEQEKAVVTDTGEFLFASINLADGENEVYAFSYNPTSKLESEKSKSHTVIVDTTKPKLTITSPSNEAVFRSERERIVTFVGSVDEDGSRVMVGERLAIVSPENTFSVSYQLVEGDQEIIVRATDKAGNETEEKLKLKWEK